MTTTPFPYPGGKSKDAVKIINRMPDHHTYVEAFGGSGAVLFNKPLSEQEIYNDLDGDIVHFFETIRDKAEEVEEVLEYVPFAEDYYHEWTKRWYEGWRPTDDALRAAVFYFSRYAQWGGKYEACSGFTVGSGNNKAELWSRKKRSLTDFEERLEQVHVLNRDYRRVLDHFDGPETFFYLDPPYVDTEGRYISSSGGFDHEEFAEILSELEGDWIISYGTDIPEGLEGYRGTIEERTRGIDRVHQDGKKAHERLIFNYPESREGEFIRTVPGTYALGEEDW